MLREQKGCERWTGHVFAQYGNCGSVPGRSGQETFYFPSEDQFLYHKRGENWHGGKETYKKRKEKWVVFFALESMMF